jgi:hypothetical protein
MRNILMFFLLLVFSTTGSAFLLPSIVPLVHAQSGTVIESQETDFPGVLAELIQCKRKNDVLTIKVRMKNTSSKTLRVYWPDAKKSVYLMDEANQKKYFLLKDAAGEYIYSGDPGNITANSSKISWFKFPAPPAEVEEIIIVLPGCAPFEDVPIEDK